MRDYTGTLALVRNNYILINPPSHMATGPIFLQATWEDCFLDNIYIADNLLAGDGYKLGRSKRQRRLRKAPLGG